MTTIAAAQPKACMEPRKPVQLRPIVVTFRKGREVPLLFSMNRDVDRLLKPLKNGTQTRVWNQLLAAGFVRARLPRKQNEPREIIA